ncbi:MAG: hypothetical protein ACPGRH_04835 [Alphaproteobacteria bacterium]
MKLSGFTNILAFGLSLTTFASAQVVPNRAGPNCHIVQSANSSDGGQSYQQISEEVITSASVPEAVIFNGEKLLYFVNGDFDSHSIHVSTLSNDSRSVSNKLPIKLNGEIIGDAVDPDLIVTTDGRLRIYYYVGMFTRPVTENKPADFFSAVSDDGINFEVEGVIATVEGGTDPTVVRRQDGTYLLAIPQAERMNIEILESADGISFRKIGSLEGGIPELTLSESGNVEILFQDSEGIVKLTSQDGGRTWGNQGSSILKGASAGVASPSVIRLDEQNRTMFYFRAREGCTTAPNAYLTDKNALLPNAGHKGQAQGAPPLGDGVSPTPQGNAEGPPPLGDGVAPPQKSNN